MEDFLKLLMDKYKDSNRIPHSIGVKNMAVALAEKLGVDKEKAQIAALFHDYYRYESDEELINLMDKFDYSIYKDMPWSFHGLAAGNQIKNFGIEDKDIINAIKYHTTGRKKMSMLEKIIYVSDFAEETRTHEGASLVRELAYKNFDEAFLKTIELTYNHTKDSRVLELLNYYGGTMNELTTVITILDKLNVSNLKIYDLTGNSPFFDYVVIATATSDRQANAAIRDLKDVNGSKGFEIRGIEEGGREWTLIDCKSIIIHIFDPETRNKYGLDTIYSTCKQIDVMEVI